MNKGKKVTKLKRSREQKEALLRSLSNDLVMRGALRTTEKRAKALRPYVERLITKARRGDLASRRYVAQVLEDKATSHLCDEVAPQYRERPGGYTRIIKAPQRESDQSKMAIIELV
ncbi:MAG: 50S ribosomal protein L17 [Parcubacteria group bacterium SW_4_49_11]|nr:MAG: 50S ribosomal protein L17 [Parcubacteria group bacterium SW_4_49_11]